MIISAHTILPTVPKRIISLVPSQTELLAYLGLDAETVGITKFCIHPDHWFQTKTRVGGTKKLHLEKIEALKPDLIIANAEENTLEDVSYLAERFPVYVSDVKNTKDALSMIKDIGRLTNKTEEAADLSEKIEVGFKKIVVPLKPLRALYLIWREPYMTIGGDTFISDMMLKAGFDNIYETSQRYPEITAADISSCGAEVIMLSSEPYPFKEKHIAELNAVAPTAKTILADGELFSWYGSRMLKAPEYFKALQSSFQNDTL